MIRLAFLFVWLVSNCTAVPAADRVGARVQTDVVRFPPSANVVNVQQAPYLAKGDGVTDDTDALQRAIDDTMGLGKVVYFPKGVYLVSRSLKWSKRNSSGREAWGFNYLQGSSPDEAIIRLRDSTFTAIEKPQSIMWCGGFGSADWFHNYVQGLTFDVGKNNPAAIALQFYSNNSGAVRNCRFQADQSSGLIGLDLAHRDMNGPLLVQNCEVSGFRRGIVTGHAVNGQTFEHITLRDQAEVGLANEGQTISIRSLLSHNSVPALQTYGTCCLIEADLHGRAESSSKPAVINFNSGRIYLRDVRSTLYARTLADVETPDAGAAYRITNQEQPRSVGPSIVEYWTARSPDHQEVRELDWKIAIEEPPQTNVEPVERWANVDDFGADPSGQRDSSTAIQKAIDSGAGTIFLPGSYALRTTVIVRGKAQRLVGIGGWLDYQRQVTPDLRIEDGVGHVTIEHLANVHGGVEINSARTVVFRSVSDCDLTFTPKSQRGRLFLEDFVTHDLNIDQQQVWARQLNVENEGTHVTNTGGQLWILGYKTERGGTLLHTRSHGRSEVLGGFSYTTTAGKLAPMFINDQAQLFTFFTEICFNGDPFEELLVERGSQPERIFKRNQIITLPYRSP